MRKELVRSIMVMMGLILILFLAGMVSAVTRFVPNVTFFAAFVIMMIILVIHMTRRNLWSEYGFDKKAHNVLNPVQILPLIIIAIVPLFAGLDDGKGISDIVYIVLYMFIVAFVEEVIYRGIILTNLKKKSVRYGIIGSSLMFGISHLITAAGGKDILDVIYQVVMAIVAGIILATIVISTKNIYICIIYHYVNNVSASISGTFGRFDQLVSIIVLILMVVYASVLIAKIRKEEQKETLEEV